MPIDVDATLDTELQSNEQDVIVYLLKLTNRDESLILHFTSNNEDIKWGSDIYVPLDFSLQIPKYSDQNPRTTLTISNQNRVFQSYVEADAPHFGSGWQVDIYIVSGIQINKTLDPIEMTEDPFYHIPLQSKSISTNAQTATILLGVENPRNEQFSPMIYSPLFCQRKFDDGEGCPYTAEGLLQLDYLFEGLTIDDYTIGTYETEIYQINTDTEEINSPSNGYNAFTATGISAFVDPVNELNPIRVEIDNVNDKIVALSFRKDVNTTLSFPSSFTVSGTNDDINYDIVSDISNPVDLKQSEYQGEYLIRFTNNTSYAKYRIEITENNTGHFQACQ